MSCPEHQNCKDLGRGHNMSCSYLEIPKYATDCYYYLFRKKVVLIRKTVIT